MKLTPLIALSALVMLTGCYSTDEGADANARDDMFIPDDSRAETLYELPTSYNAAMEELVERATDLNRQITSSAVSQGRNNAWIMVNVVKHMQTLQPSQGINSVDDRKRYNRKMLDLFHSINVVEMNVGKRQIYTAMERLDVFIERFNEISREFGPGKMIEDFRPSRDLGLPDRYRHVDTGIHTY